VERNSIRSGTLTPKQVKAAEDSWRLHPRCSVEDPFEVSYDVAHSTFRTIRLEAARAYGLLTGIYADAHFAPSDSQSCIDEICQQVVAAAAAEKTGDAKGGEDE